MKNDEHVRLKNDSNISLPYSVLEDLCVEIYNQPKVRFCGIVNPMGRLIVGGLKDGIESLENETQRQMLYIQSYLEMTMKRDFDDTLGRVEYNITQRDNLVVISIPLKQDYLLLLSAEKNAEIKQIIQISTDLIGRIMPDEKNHFPLNGNSTMSPEFA